VSVDCLVLEGKKETKDKRWKEYKNKQKLKGIDNDRNKEGKQMTKKKLNTVKVVINK
jgi:hypothetical protein